MLRYPTAFCRGAVKILLSSVRTAETILPTTVYMKECSCSLTEKNALRKEGFPVTSILPEMTDPSTGCRIRTSTDIYTDVTKELRRSEFEGLDSYFKNEYNKANEVL